MGYANNKAGRDLRKAVEAVTKIKGKAAGDSIKWGNPGWIPDKQAKKAPAKKKKRTA